MTLGFLLYFDKAKKQPTHFPEKILRSLDVTYLEYLHHLKGYKWNDPSYPFKQYDIPKIHTIRSDEKDRWRGGMDIHFVVGNRTPKRYQFAPVIKCTGVQKIFMTYDSSNGLEISIDHKYHYWRSSELWKNDGFDTLESFEEYFINVCERNDGEFSGKIIHWKDKRY